MQFGRVTRGAVTFEVGRDDVVCGHCDAAVAHGGDGAAVVRFFAAHAHQGELDVDVGQLAARLQELTRDELAVVVQVVTRLLDVGRRSYGPLQLDSDQRDFEAEADDEITDWMIYRAMNRISRARRARGKPC